MLASLMLHRVGPTIFAFHISEDVIQHHARYFMITTKKNNLSVPKDYDRNNFNVNMAD